MPEHHYRIVFAFVDGTVRPTCRPGQMQRVVYNWHKRVHALTFQALTTPNGLVANLFGPVEGRRHDSGMLRDSGLYTQLQIMLKTKMVEIYVSMEI